MVIADRKRQPLLHSRRAALASGAMALAGLLTACRRKPAPPPQPVVQPVRVAFWGERAAHQPRGMIERGLINSFREVEPRIEIQYAGGAPLSTGKLAEALGAGQAADAFGISLEEFGPLQAKNVLAETDYSAWGGNVKSARQVADLYVEGTVEPLIERESGRLLALPADVVNLCLLVHGRHVQEVGLEARRDTPRAWDDLLGFAQRLTRREAGVVIRRGFEFFYGPQGLATELGMATQLGGDFFAPDRRSTNLAAPPFVRALEFQHEYVFKHRLGDPTVRDPVQAFLHEQLSSVLAGPATVVALQKNNPALLETLHVAQIPMFKDSRRRSGSAWDGSLWAVSAAASAEVQAAAWRWLRHLSEAAPLYYEAFGMLHPHRELRAAPQFKELRPAGVQTPFGEVFLWDLRHGTVHLIHPDVEALRSIWQRAREMVLRDGLIPRDQLQRAKLEIDPILARSAPTP